MRAIRLFIKEGEGDRSEVSAFQEGRQGPLAASEDKKTAYQFTEQVSPRIREEDFAKQLRIARYLAASSLPPSRALESIVKTRAPRQGRPVTKAGSKAKPEPARQKAGEAELAKERRRAGQVGRRKAPSSGPRRRKGTRFARALMTERDHALVWLINDRHSFLKVAL
jgi:hypothetical protein